MVSIELSYRFESADTINSHIKKMISQCLEFTQTIYWPQNSHFSTENDGLIISL